MLDEDQVDVSNVQDPARDYNNYTYAIPVNSSHNNMKTNHFVEIETAQFEICKLSLT